MSEELNNLKIKSGDKVQELHDNLLEKLRGNVVQAEATRNFSAIVDGRTVSVTVSMTIREG